MNMQIVATLFIQYSTRVCKLMTVFSSVSYFNKVIGLRYYLKNKKDPKGVLL